MTVGDDGRLALPWQAAPLAQALARQRGHALLLHGAAGDGTLAFAMALAQALLCEAAAGAAPGRPCGRCGSCRLVQAHGHPDLFVLLPETLRRAHGWPLADDKADDEGKRKPSKQVRVDEVRRLIDWVTRTSARGAGKVALIFPAESLNASAANALLKTLEEPPPGTRLLLGAGDPAHLLPTVNSRCQRVAVTPPCADEATRWLQAQGVDGAEVLLAAAGGRPLDALALSQAGVDAAAWAALPQAVQRGQGAALAGWPVPQAVDALQKVCHDALALACGAPPRYFPAASLPPQDAAAVAGLSAWSRDLLRVSRHDEHAWNEGLLVEALLSAGRRALSPPRTHRTLGP